MTDLKAGEPTQKDGKFFASGECKYVGSAGKAEPNVVSAVTFETGGALFQLTNLAPPTTAAEHKADFAALVASIKPTGAAPETAAKSAKGQNRERKSEVEAEGEVDK